MVPTKQEFENVLIERHTMAVHKKLKNAKIAIAGIGGLGSNIAVSLARIGVGHLFVVDFDAVDMSNLNRQQYYYRQLGMSKTDAITEIIHEINPYIDVKSKTVKVTEANAAEIFGGYGIVCEAFDRAENKAMLINTLMSAYPDMKIISGSGMAGYLSSNTIQTRRVMKNLYICGDGVTDSAEVNGLMAPRVAICANHQANMVVRLICDG